MTESDERIEAIAARQHGVLSRRQLLEAGVSPAAVTRRVRAGRLRPIHRGVYRVGPIEAARSAAMAAVLAGGRKALLSHLSAAHTWGLLRGGLLRPIDVSVPSSGRSTRQGIRFHRVVPLAEDERALVDEIPVTAPGRTLVDAATMLGRREIERVVAVAERQGMISSGELAALPARYAGRRGMAGLRSVIEDVRGPDFDRSEAERRCAALLREGELPRPYLNVPVGPYELDMFWPDAGVAVEIDGRAYHWADARFEGDRQKDRWLAARGIQVVRLTWKRITRKPVAAAVEVGQALAVATVDRRARTGRPSRTDSAERPDPGFEWRREAAGPNERNAAADRGSG